MHEHIQYAPTVWWYENSGQAQIAAGHWWLGGTSTVKTGQDISQPPSALSLSGYVQDTRLQSINQSLSSFNYKVLSPLELAHVFASVTAKQWMSMFSLCRVEVAEKAFDFVKAQVDEHTAKLRRLQSRCLHLYLLDVHSEK